MRDAPVLSSSLWPFIGLPSKSRSLLYGGAQNWTQHSRCGLTCAEQRGPVGNTLPNAAQDTIRLLCSEGTLLPPVQPGVHQDSHVLFSKAFHLGDPQPVLMHGVVPPQVQHFDLLLVELHEVPVSLFLQSVSPRTNTHLRTANTNLLIIVNWNRI